MTRDIESLNETILAIDLDDLEVEALDQRIELSLAVLFGETDGGAANSECQTFNCHQFTCTGYWPE